MRRAATADALAAAWIQGKTHSAVRPVLVRLGAPLDSTQLGTGIGPAPFPGRARPASVPAVRGKAAVCTGQPPGSESGRRAGNLGRGVRAFATVRWGRAQADPGSR